MALYELILKAHITPCAVTLFEAVHSDSVGQETWLHFVMGGGQTFAAMFSNQPRQATK